MPHRREFLGMLTAALPAAATAAAGDVRSARSGRRATVVDIVANAFHINRQPTFPGRTWRGSKVEGLIFISRMANCIVDDQNPETRGTWSYRDGPWDPERNTREFIAMLPAYRSHGLNAVALNIQGGSPVGYGWHQPWRLSGYSPDGRLLPAYRERLLRVLDALDANGMAAVLGLFYVGATPRLGDEAALVRAADEVTDLICEQGYTNVLIEIGNEVDLPSWPFEIVKPARSHELVQRIQQRSTGRVANGRGRLLVSTSYVLGTPPARFLGAADFILLHGNAAKTPDALRTYIRGTRAAAGYRGQPLLINEDDHFAFEAADNDMLAAVQEYCGWGYFDYRDLRERFEDGYQSLPVDWGINSARKKAFFNLLAQITGARAV